MSHNYIPAHDDPHLIGRSGWLRAAVLGANDGIVSISSLIVGVAATDSSNETIFIAGTAGLVAGAMSMAAGEYVSVSSQSDIEKIDIARERQSLRDLPIEEERELASILEARGLSAQTAAQAAHELTAHDALAAHIREELELSQIHSANPLQAALTSALTFFVAASCPLVAAIIAPASFLIPTVIITTLLSLSLLGALGAYAGGAPKTPAVLRVVFWGAAAMATTILVGHFFGASI